MEQSIYTWCILCKNIQIEKIKLFHEFITWSDVHCVTHENDL